MCFSAEASFGVGAALVAAGAYCAAAAQSADRRYLPVALGPALFGVQQLSEGAVWLGLGRHDPDLTRSAALVFLFFALAFWPVWLPLSAARVERRPPQRRAWWAVALLGVGWGVFLYLPLLREPDRYLDVRVLHHSIHYDYAAVPVMQWIGPLPRRVFYVVSGMPLVACSDARVRRFGWLLGLSAVLTLAAFRYAFASVWCFFAAALALYLCWAIPRTSPEAATP